MRAKTTTAVAAQLTIEGVVEVCVCEGDDKVFG